MVAGVTDGKVVVDCATLTPERMVDEANRISAKGGSFLEAPVSGSKVTSTINIIFFPPQYQFSKILGPSRSRTTDILVWWRRIDL